MQITLKCRCYCLLCLFSFGICVRFTNRRSSTMLLGTILLPFFAHKSRSAINHNWNYNEMQLQLSSYACWMRAPHVFALAGLDMKQMHAAEISFWNTVLTQYLVALYVEHLKEIG